MGLTHKMEVNAKSTRHSKITVDFGEALVLYWLSKRGFECARVDHTGIDLIARRPRSKEILGISVKSRSRKKGKETESINLLVKDDAKILSACDAFHCEPYVAFVADQGQYIRCFLLRLTRARRIIKASALPMTDSAVLRYKKDSQIEFFELESREGWPLLGLDN